MSLPLGFKPCKRIKDPLFEELEFTWLENHIIESDEFQSLAAIKQLGLVCEYYPSANQSRYEHMLLTCYLSGWWLYDISRHQPELKITNTWIQLVRLAGLLHDIGHVCFGHLFDQFIQQNQDIEDQIFPEMKDHESRGICLIHDLFERFKGLKVPDVDDCLESHDSRDSQDFHKYNHNYAHCDYPFILSNGAQIIADMIRGQRQSEISKTLPAFLFQFVANKHSELDSDKLAYLTVDSKSVGNPHNLQIQRIFNHTRVSLNSQNLIWSKSISRRICDVFELRRLMFIEVYQHPHVIQRQFEWKAFLKCIFAVYDVPSILNQHKQNKNEWRFLLTDAFITHTKNTLLYKPSWLPSFDEDKRRHIDAWLQFHRSFDHLKLVKDSEESEPEDGPFALNTLHTLRTRLLDTNDENKSDVELVSNIEYKFANCTFDVSTHIELYMDAADLSKTDLLCNMPRSSTLDFKQSSAPIHRTLVYQNDTKTHHTSDKKEANHSTEYIIKVTRDRST